MATLRELIDEQERQASYVRKNPASIGHGGSILGSLVPFSLNQNEDVRLKEEKKEKKRRLVEAEKKARKKVNKLLAERKKLLNEKKKGSKSPPPEVMPETPPDITVPDTPVDSTLLKKPIVDPQVNLGPEVDPNAGAFNNIPNQTIGNNNRPPPPVVELGELPQANTPASTVEEVDQIEGANTAYEVSKILGINLSPESVKQTQEMLPDVWDAIKKLSDKVAARDPYQSQLGPLAPIPRAPSTNASDFYDYNSLARIADFSGAGPAGTSVQDRQGIDLNAQVGNLRDQRETEYLKRLAATQAARQGQIAAEDSRRKAYEATTDQTTKEMDLYTKVVDTLKKGQPTADTAKNMVELYKNVTGQDQNVDLAQAKHDEEATKLQQKDVESRRNIIANWRDKRASAQEALHQYMVGDGTERAKAQLSADVTIAVNNGTLTQKEGQELRQQAESVWKTQLEAREKVKDRELKKGELRQGVKVGDKNRWADLKKHRDDLAAQLERLGITQDRLDSRQGNLLRYHDNKDIRDLILDYYKTDKDMEKSESGLRSAENMQSNKIVADRLAAEEAARVTRDLKEKDAKIAKEYEEHKLKVNKPYIVDAEERDTTRTKNVALQKGIDDRLLQSMKNENAKEVARIMKGNPKDGGLSDLDKKLVDQDGKQNLKVYDAQQKSLNNVINMKLRAGDNASTLKDLSDSGIFTMPAEARETLFRPLMDLAGGINPDKKNEVSVTDVKGFLKRIETWKKTKASKIKTLFSNNPGKAARVLNAANKIEARMTRIAAKLNRRLRSEKEGLGRMAFPDEIREIRDIMHPGKTNNELMQQGILEIRSNGHMLNEYLKNVDNLKNSLPNNKRLSDLTKRQKQQMVGQLLPGITSAVSLGNTLFNVIKKAHGDSAKSTLIPIVLGENREVEALGLKVNEDGTATPGEYIEELKQIRHMTNDYKLLFTNPNRPSKDTLKSPKILMAFMKYWSAPGRILSTTAIQSIKRPSKK